MITNEFKSLKIVTIIQESTKLLYNSNNSLLILNLIVLIGCILNFLSAHNIAYNLLKPGSHSKLKVMLVILGAPLFTTLFLVTYLAGVQIAFGVKILVEILIIVVAYIELNEIECSAKGNVESQSILSKLAPLARSRKGAFEEYWQTKAKIEEISNELGSEELKRLALDAVIQSDLAVLNCSASNLVSIKKHLDPLHHIRSAEWQG